MLRSLQRCVISIGFSLIISIGILFALHSTSIVQARPAGSIVNCAGPIQTCINSASIGDTIVITPGTYLESLTLNKAVSLTGVSALSVTIKAISNQRVLTVTGSSISNGVIISGLTFANGNVSGGIGGGILITGSAQPLLQNVIISNNLAASGGGLFATQAITLTNAQFISNTANGGGGIGSTAPIVLNGGYFERNVARTGLGGGVATTSSLSINGSIFMTNSAAIWGGAAFSIGPAQLIGGLYQANQAIGIFDAQGGAVYISNTLSISGSTFISNSAHAEGGGVYATLIITSINAQFISNTSQIGAAGGMYGGDGLSLTSTQFLSNSADADGGGALIRGSIKIASALFRNNRSNSATGGGLYLYGTGLISGTLFVSNTANYNGGAVEATGLLDSSGIADVYFINSQIVRNSSLTNNGGGVYSDVPLATINTQFISNTAQVDGGGLYANAGAFIYDSEFRTNTAVSGYGGGLRAFNSLTISNTNVLSNTSTGKGGGGLMADGYSLGPADVTMIDGIFSNNRAVCNNCAGGAAYISTTLQMIGTRFISNTAKDDGGAIAAYGPATIANASFENNTSLGSCGGAVYASLPSILTSTNFFSNTAVFCGGGLAANSAVTITGGLFQNNRVTFFNGGGLYAPAYLNLKDTKFISNSAVGWGGGAEADGPFQIVNGYFERNSSSTGGGLQAGIGSISQTQFIGNHAGAHGGGLFTSGTARVVNSLFARNSADDQSAELYSTSANLTLLHNTFADSGSNLGAAIFGGGGWMGITDTIIANHAIAISNTFGTVYEDYNLFFSNPITRSGSGISGGAHDVLGNPKFVDPVHDNYHILTGSAAIDTGVNAGVSIDFDGQTRPFGLGFDIGYDEYVILKVYLPIVLKNH